MSDKTKIEWTDATWNAIRGCSRISEGCRNCYAESVANRFKGEGLPYEGLIARTGQWNGKIKAVDSVMDQPFRWKKPRRIFVNSMSDLFHENLPFSEIDKIFAVMSAANWHTYQVLTKRAYRMQEYFKNDDWIDRVRKIAWNLNPASAYHETHMIGGLPNVWLGVSVEDQKAAEERIPFLLETPAAVRWISAEPLIGPIDFSGMWVPSNPAIHVNMLEKLDWVVVGGESGKSARPMHPDWARTLRDQCVALDVPFLFKQWGEWLPGELVVGKTVYAACSDGKIMISKGNKARDNFGTHPDIHSGNLIALKVGKKAAGRLLDGKEWNQYPS